jgi:tetratricopeptide (TPR) repeat protein
VTPVVARPTTTASNQVPGYELLGELGRGGMGVVYKAKQTGLNRLVALKMILASGHANEDDLRRFRLEAEAVARLHHPHIVQIYDIGEHHGLPYFSLEYCTGGTLAQQLNGTPLPPSVAARWLQQVADAVHTAHQAGILHRDLKPANILLQGSSGDSTQLTQVGSSVRSAPVERSVGTNPTNDSAPTHLNWQPKLTDFGLAKELNVDSGQTQSGAILGTPSYMAPEQADSTQQKQIGPPADIWALGAVLYETLTGRPPFKGATPMGTILQVMAQDPVPPTQLQPTLPRDLETIALKCLNKDARKRYPSARALADDLQRFLAGEPVLARPAGLLERTAKWVRRRPAIAGLTLGMIGLFVLGFSLVTWQWRSAVHAWQQADEHRLRAEAQESEARTQRDAALAARHRARQALDTLTDGVVEQLLVQQELTADQTAFLGKVLQQYQAMTVAANASVADRVSQGEAYLRLATINHRLQRLDDALVALDASSQLFAALADEVPTEPYYRVRVGLNHSNRGNFLRSRGQLDAAQTEYRAAVEQMRAVVADHPTTLVFQWELATAQNNLANLLHSIGQVEAGARLAQATLVLRRRLVEAEPTTFGYRRDLARSLNTVANHLRSHGQIPAAERHWREALAVLDALLAEHAKHGELLEQRAGIQLALATLLRFSGRPTEAEPLIAAAERVRRALVVAAPADVRLQRELAVTLNNRGSLQRQLKQNEQAEAAWKEAQALHRQLLGLRPNNPETLADLATTCFNLGNLYSDIGPTAQADEAYRAALELQSKLIAQSPQVVDYQTEYAATSNNYGLLLIKLGQIPAAVTQFTQATQTRAKLTEQFPTNVEHLRNHARCLTNLGEAQARLQAFDLADQHLRAAVAVRQKVLELRPDVPPLLAECAETTTRLGGMLMQAQRYSAAQTAFQAVLQLRTQLHDLTPHQTEAQAHRAAAHFDLAGSAYFSKDRASAQQHLEQARTLYRPVVARLAAHRANYRQVLVLLADLHLDQQALLPAVALAEEVQNVGHSASADAYEAAALWARCATLPAVPNSPDCAAKSVTALTTAIAAGFTDRAKLLADARFAAVRERADFQTLLKRLAK